jgi:uncharacterized membrane protein YhaH (DUF805 family)
VLSKPHLRQAQKRWWQFRRNPQMIYKNRLLELLKNVFPPKGRMKQKDYILWQLLLIGITFGLYILAFVPIPGVLFLIYAVQLFEIYLSSKRLQDCNFSGWFSLLILIPKIGFLIPIILCFYPSTKGTNEFGLDPRIINNLDENKNEINKTK